jgi:O-antigen/teichoic acid export membrane protein
MGVLGPSSFGGDLKAYMQAQVRLYFVVVGAMGLLFAVIVFLDGQFGGNSLLCNILTAIGVTLTFMLLPWMLRRVFYVLGKPSVALEGSIIYAILLILLTFCLKQVDGLTGLSSVFVVAVAGLISGLFLLTQLGFSKRVIPIAMVLNQNWNFGRWLILSSILMVISAQAQIYIAGNVLGLGTSGVIYALQTLSQPMTLTVTAIIALMTPSLSGDYAKGDFKSFKRKAYSMTIVLTSLAIVFELFLILCKGSIESIIYGGKFSRDINLIPIWGLSPLITSLVSGIQSSLQAARYSYSLLIASLFWLPVSLGSCLILIHDWGLWGVAWSTVLGYLALAIVLAALYWYWLLKAQKAIVGI